MTECEFQPICSTTNFWVVEKADFIKEVCKTEEHVNCLHCLDFVNQGIKKDSEEWKKIVKFFEERCKQFPPHGVINVT
jgi:putative component of membrane protein insertase Oxa1/YidC/SpoIIIJ protein YidD